ncbi:MAG: type IV secretion system DNA-binding domain-containing protein [bacterium]|nr:type IV secretion system DNA-binding domain-containing protein [bacterium]
MDENKVTYFAETDSRGKKTKFGIKQKDRTRHVYVIGKTGMGKSTMLENMAVQDILDGHGMCFIDPHGKTAELLLEYIPEHRKNDVLYFAPFDLDHPVSFNVLEKVDADKRHLVVSGLMSTFKKIWEDAWSARMEYILSNTLLALLEYPDATLLGVNRMLADKAYRQKVVDNVTDPSVKAFWVDEFAKYTDRFAAEATPAIQNKIGQFTSNALIRNMIGQPKSSFNIREMMDERKIIIVNLSKGRVGEQNANLLGGMLITKIYLAAMSRADVPDRILKTLPNFYLFVDEFQSFANKSFADILSEARKYKLNLTIAHQYIEQMEEEVRAAVFGNVGTMTIFRVGAFDAEIFEKEYAPVFTAEDIVNLGFAQIYLKLMIDGISSQPFSATTLPPIAPAAKSYREEVIEASRKQFSLTRKEVEDEINKWHEPISSGSKGGGASGGNGGFKDQNGGGQRFANKPADRNSANNSAVNNTTSIKPKIPVEEVKQPFREVLAGIMINDNKKPEEHAENISESGSEKPTPISLSALAPKGHAIHGTAHLPPEVKKIADKDRVILGQKIPTKENISDLKKALDKINSLEKDGATNIANKDEIDGCIKKEPVPKMKTESTNSKEIPEEVLRNMLKVDEE